MHSRGYLYGRNPENPVAAQLKFQKSQNKKDQGCSNNSILKAWEYQGEELLCVCFEWLKKKVSDVHRYSCQDIFLRRREIAMHIDIFPLSLLSRLGSTPSDTLICSGVGLAPVCCLQNKHLRKHPTDTPRVYFTNILCTSKLVKLFYHY